MVCHHDRTAAEIEVGMDLNEKRISVSVTTLEFKSAGTGTRLTFTEHAVFLDGGDKPEDREHGTKELLGSLDEELRRETTTQKS